MKAKTEVTQELREKVIRAYTVKGLSLRNIDMMIVSRVIAERILDEAGIIREKINKKVKW